MDELGSAAGCSPTARGSCGGPGRTELRRRFERARAGHPHATVSGLDARPIIGTPLDLHRHLRQRVATQTGYGPFIDLILPATGADGAGAAVDDGISFVSATYLGLPVTATVLTFIASGRRRTRMR